MKYIPCQKNPDDILNSVINVVHHYYPIGFKALAQQYSGSQELMSIIGAKIKKNLIDNTLPSDILALKADILHHFQDALFVYFDSHYQFPNYSISIELSKDSSEFIERTLRFTIKISLLTNLYTFFYEHQLLHLDILFPTIDKPVLSHVLSLDWQSEKDKGETIQKVTSLIEKHFPDYHYVDHHFLFSVKINSGVLYGDELSSFGAEHSVYEFLFDNNFLLNATILQ